MLALLGVSAELIVISVVPCAQVYQAIFLIDPLLMDPCLPASLEGKTPLFYLQSRIKGLRLFICYNASFSQ